MYLDFGDDRPDTPRVPRALPESVVVTLSVAWHALLLVVIAAGPGMWSTASGVEAVPAEPPRDPVRFVEVLPLIDRTAPPRSEAPDSDLDRRSATVERPPDARDRDPFSRGNTPEPVGGAPTPPARAAGSPADGASPAPDSSPADVDPADAIEADAETIPLRELLARNRPAPQGNLGDALRDLQRYLQQDNFESPNGGWTDDGAAIQFDSRGVDFGPWLRRFRAQVRSNWFVPQVAMVSHGRVVLQFYVHRDGRLSDLRVVGPSSIDAFNTSAYNAIRLSNPTLPLPDEYPVDQVLFTVTFFYNEDPRASRR